MKSVIQRVNQASVTIEKELYSSIGVGILVLLCIEKGDTLENAKKMADKLSKLRIFEDENGKMNKSILDIKGEMLIVSQFTLAGNCKKGTRPSFDMAAAPEEAKKLYEEFTDYIKSYKIPVKTGKFQAMMDISLVNNGPVTFIIDN